MKRFNKFISALAVLSFPLFTVACVEEADSYTPGEPDVEGCYGVYFPAQEIGGVIAPTDPTSVTISAARTNASGAITVPLELADETGVFTLGELSFADGQKESTVVLDFSKADVGVQYECSITVANDPLYISNYSHGNISFDFSVMRVKWVSLGMAKYNDMLPLYNGVPEIFYESELQQREDSPNNFRLVKPYATFISDLGLPTGREPDEYLYFNLLQPGQTLSGQKITKDGLVYFQPHFIGLWLSQYSDDVEIMHPAHFKTTPSESDWTNNRVLQYQKNGLPAAIQLAPFYYMPNNGGFNYSDTEGLITIIFPGAVLTDYTLKVQASETDSQGVLPLAFTTGSDVAKVKYGIYEGVLSATQAQAKVAEINENEKAASFVPDHNEAYDVVGVNCGVTGEYTVVAVSYDAKGIAQTSAYTDFKYLAAGDEDHAVVVVAGLEKTNRFQAQGYNSENSLAFYVSGKNLESVRLGVYEYAKYSANPENIHNSLLKTSPVDEETLAAINDKGYDDLFIELSSGTKYVLVVAASNGYATKFVVAEETTDGVSPLPVYKDYDLGSLAGEYAFADKDEAAGEYNLYAVDLFSELGMREYLGKSKVALSDTPDETDEEGYLYQYVNVSGFAGPVFAELGLDDNIEWALSDGVLYGLDAATTVDGKSEFNMYAAGDGKVYSGGGNLLLGIPVADGYYAFVSHPKYENPYNFTGFAFINEGVDPKNFLCAYADYLLVDPAKDENGLAPAKAAKAAAAANNYLRNRGCVETFKGAAASAIEIARKAFASQASFKLAGKSGAYEHKAVDFKTVKCDVQMPEAGRITINSNLKPITK